MENININSEVPNNKGEDESKECFVANAAKEEKEPKNRLGKILYNLGKNIGDWGREESKLRVAHQGMWGIVATELFVGSAILLVGAAISTEPRSVCFTGNEIPKFLRQGIKTMAEQLGEDIPDVFGKGFYTYLSGAFNIDGVDYDKVRMIIDPKGEILQQSIKVGNVTEFARVVVHGGGGYRSPFLFQYPRFTEEQSTKIMNLLEKLSKYQFDQFKIRMVGCWATMQAAFFLAFLRDLRERGREKVQNSITAAAVGDLIKKLGEAIG